MGYPTPLLLIQHRHGHRPTFDTYIVQIYLFSFIRCVFSLRFLRIFFFYIYFFMFGVLCGHPSQACQDPTSHALPMPLNTVFFFNYWSLDSTVFTSPTPGHPDNSRNERFRTSWPHGWEVVSETLGFSVCLQIQ